MTQSKLSIFIPLYYNDSQLHARKKDEEVDEVVYQQVMKTSPQCYICSFQFQLTKSLERHIQQIHTIDLSSLGDECALCSSVYPTTRTILRHLRNDHRLDRNNTLKQYAHHRFHRLNRQNMPQTKPKRPKKRELRQSDSVLVDLEEDLIEQFLQESQTATRKKIEVVPSQHPPVVSSASKAYYCSHCQMRQMNATSYQLHLRQYHPEDVVKSKDEVHKKRYYCAQCDISKPSHTGYMKHLYLIHRAYHP
ncbi:hypothetical protein A0J61_10021 [Choanephora cucurbitarum]|uniref:C2H2-type domain-containing protein n=1 Tax=Choanephora cucurbitarum TaxID=101091 RepID=A0A1C7MYS4_9FUNG|nr:hypothetical protein A0J61_10021 [Choanephora cucurbitarum]